MKAAVCTGWLDAFGYLAWTEAADKARTDTALRTKKAQDILAFMRTLWLCGGKHAAGNIIKYEGEAAVRTQGGFPSKANERSICKQ